jgi:hypothetical protein
MDLLQKVPLKGDIVLRCNCKTMEKEKGMSVNVDHYQKSSIRIPEWCRELDFFI